MKRIAFAWVTFSYTFDTVAEALEFANSNINRGWFFGDIKKADGFWTLEVRKPYSKQYLPGW